jgi:ribosome modulation factor
VTEATDAYIAGYDAGLKGKSKLSNPYELHSQQDTDWRSGYKRGYDLAWFTRKEGYSESSIIQD